MWLAFIGGCPCARPHVVCVFAGGFIVSFVFCWICVCFEVPEEVLLLFYKTLCSATVTFGGSGAWNRSSTGDRLAFPTHDYSIGGIL